MLEPTPIPPIIEDLLSKLMDQKLPQWQRQNCRATLVGIAGAINKEITKFDREVNSGRK